MKCINCKYLTQRIKIYCSEHDCLIPNCKSFASKCKEYKKIHKSSHKRTKEQKMKYKLSKHTIDGWRDLVESVINNRIKFGSCGICTTVVLPDTDYYVEVTIKQLEKDR